MSTLTSLKPPEWMPASARSYRHLSQLWQVPAFLAGVLAMVAVLGGAAIHQGQTQQELAAEFHRTRLLLQSPNPDLTYLTSRIEKLLARSDLTSRQNGEARLLMATALLKRAETQPRAKNNDLILRARQHLEHAELAGVVPENRGRMWYLLGKTLFLTGKDLHQAINYLQRALPKGADNPVEGYGFLVKAYLKLPRPDVDAALKANEQLLNTASDDQVLMPARLLRSELLIRKKLNVEAIKTLKRIDSTAPPAIYQQALLLRAECCEAEGLWNNAAPLWQELLVNPANVPGGKRRILYTLGRCYANAKPANREKAVEAWTQAQDEGGEEGMAAGLRLAELYMFGPHHNFDESVVSLGKALVDVADRKSYKNRFVSLMEAAEIVKLGIHESANAGAFLQAQQLAGLYKSLESGLPADRLFAEVTERWAVSVEQKAGANKEQKSRWLAAADAYERAAGAPDSKVQGDMLWSSARCFDKAGEPEKRLAVLERYVALPLTRERVAEGWYALGEAHHALGQKEYARKAWHKCLEHSTGKFVQTARLRLAEEQVALKQLDKAIDILKESGKINAQTDLAAHEKSLYLLATLLYQKQNYTESYFYLQKATERYANNHFAYPARDMLADCCRQLGKRAGEKLKKYPDLPPDEKQDAEQKRRHWMEKAAKNYRQLADDLEMMKDRQRKKGINPALDLQKERLLRKAAFAVSDIEFEAENFSEALRWYRLLAADYRGQLEELFACHGVWLCCKALKHQPKQYQLAVDATKKTLQSVMKTLPALSDEQFRGTYTRTVWQNYFSRMNAEIQQISTRALRTPLPPSQPDLPAPPAPIGGANR